MLYLGTDRPTSSSCASDGKMLWQFNAPGAIKASPSYHDGNVFVADYQSAMFALDAKSGKLVWRTNTSKAPPFGEAASSPPPRSPSASVYAARDDGTVFAFDEKTGKVAWYFPTGAAVYGSPAVAQVPGTPPTVYIGAENGTLLRARRRAPARCAGTTTSAAPIPGTATVIGHTVYTSSFKTRRNRSASTSAPTRRPSSINQAGYTPMVSDGKRLYLIGYYDADRAATDQP